ncbi:MAG: amino acid permease [Planctomycetota bacterium]|jgi:amino acid transporter/nucleotide-binding universal stress UspA family protein
MAGKPPQVTSELSRELNLFHITMMGLGMMIGAGVFIGIGTATRASGPGGVILTFALNGALAVLTAMSYAELSSAIPRAGGAYNFARIGFGRGPSFIAGWMEWFASSVAGSVYTLAFSIYVLRFVDRMGWWGTITEFLTGSPIAYSDVHVKILAVLVALAFLYVNFRGASETGKVGAVFTLGQTLFLLFIGVMGIITVLQDPSRLNNFKDFLPEGWGVLLVTMGFTYVAFEGYEVIAQAGDEAINPRKNLPKAMLYSVVIVTFTYVAVAFASIVAVKAGSAELDGAAPWKWIGSYGEEGFGEAVSLLMYKPLANMLLTLAVIFASTSALNATIFSATRASYALGRDRMLPSSLASISKKRKTPWVALSGTGIIIILVAVLFETKHVASSASLMFLFLFFLVNVCVIKIRRNMGEELTYGYLMPLFPLFPIVAILCQGTLVFFMHEASVQALIIAPSWVVLGVLIYLFYSRYRAVPTPDEIVVFEDVEAPSHEEYRVMIPVANPENALNLAGIAFKACQAKNAWVELLHMVPVPDHVPLTDADRYMREGREGILEALMYLQPRFPVSTTLRYCRNISRGIVSAVREKHIDMLIMGWHGPRSTSEFVLGSTLDTVIERSPCDVLIVKDTADHAYKRILVPLAGGPNGALALEVASIVVEKTEAEIVAFGVDTGTGRGTPDLAAIIEKAKNRLQVPRSSIQTKIVETASVVDAILKESEGYDLVVLGASREPLLYKVMLDTVPNVVARTCTKPLMMVKASGGIRSWIKRYI